MSIQMVPLAMISANPYRRIDKYKLSETKIEGLIQSYGNSGFWDGSIQARPRKDGRFEIAFGHHRVEAAKRAGIPEIGLVVADRSNADMLRMMADENRDEFRADALVAVETITAVIEAYGRGEIELEPVDPKTRKEAIHLAPGGATYSLSTVARFLNWTKKHGSQAVEPTHACRVAFDAYRERASTAEALASIPSAQRSEVAVQTVTMAARTARNHAEKFGLTPAKVRQAEKKAAGDAAREVVERTGSKVRDEAVSIGRAAVAAVSPKKTPDLPSVEAYINRIIREAETVEPYAELLLKCHRLLPVADDLTIETRNRLADALERMLDRANQGTAKIITALRVKKPTAFRRLLEETNVAIETI